MSGAGGVIDLGARERVESRVILTLMLMSGGMQGDVNAAKRFGLVLVALGILYELRDWTAWVQTYLVPCNT